jgi:hypothetical protein
MPRKPHRPFFWMRGPLGRRVYSCQCRPPMTRPRKNAAGHRDADKGYQQPSAQRSRGSSDTSPVEREPAFSRKQMVVVDLRLFHVSAPVVKVLRPPE